MMLVELTVDGETPGIYLVLVSLLEGGCLGGKRHREGGGGVMR